MTKNVHTEVYKRLILLLISILIANPVILYMLFKSLVPTIAVTVLVIVVVQIAFAYLKHQLLAVYLLNFLALVSIFVHAEVVFENVFREYIIEDLYTIEDGYYFNKPYLEKRFTDKEYQVEYLTNSQGFRIGYGQHVDDEVHEVDWLFLGDSFSQGAQVDFEALYTTALYRNFPDKVILNAGISGFGIVEEYFYYKNSGSALKADKVFLQLSNFNDFMNVHEKTGGITDYLVHYSDFLRYLLQDIKYSNPAALPLGRWTEPFYPDEQSNKDYNIFYTDSSEQKQRDLDAFKQYLTLFKQEVEKNGAELFIVHIPTKEQIRFAYLDEVVSSFQIDISKLDMTLPNRLLHEMADSLDIRLIDLLDPFQQSSEDPFFVYDEHLSTYGHQLMADFITQAILEEDTPTLPRLLGNEIAGERYPMSSLDGALVSYQALSDGNSEIFLADSVFQSVQRLTFNDVDELHPMVSPELNRIIFTEGDQESMRTNVIMMNLDTGNRTSLTPEDHVFGAIPTFSHDGHTVAYAQWFYDETQNVFTNPQAILLNLLDGSKQEITSPLVESWRPIIAPSGTEVVYIAKVDGQFDVFLYSLETKTAVNLTSTAHDEWDPQFSHDGKHLVYASMADGNWDLFLYDFEARKHTQLTYTKGDEWDPSFRIDNEKILYAGQFGFLKGIYEMPLPDSIRAR